MDFMWAIRARWMSEMRQLGDIRRNLACCGLYNTITCCTASCSLTYCAVKCSHSFAISVRHCGISRQQQPRAALRLLLLHHKPKCSRLSPHPCGCVCCCMNAALAGSLLGFLFAIITLKLSLGSAGIIPGLGIPAGLISFALLKAWVNLGTLLQLPERAPWLQKLLFKPFLVQENSIMQVCACVLVCGCVILYSGLKHPGIGISKPSRGMSHRSSSGMPRNVFAFKQGLQHPSCAALHPIGQ